MSAMEKFLNKSKESYKERAKIGIEKNRKGTFTINIKSNSDKIHMSYRLKRIDFDFGANIFMLNQYDTKERNERYLESWNNIFNTAVVPLYWEGTEPQQGDLRYDINSPNNIYRRPTLGCVMDYCKKNNITMKGHPLFWHEYIPEWIPDDWNETLQLIEKRFKEISERCSDEIPVFDVVNEPSKIWDMTHEEAIPNHRRIFPPNGYVEQVFELAEKYFPSNQLILNEAVGASFVEFRGLYGGYYQLLERLINKGVRIDKIGLQCHMSDDMMFKNVYDAQRLYSILDCYGELGKELVISEISILSEKSEEVQARMVEQLYSIVFSHEKTSGIFWWNLDDDGVSSDKNRNAIGENLPTSGLMCKGVEKIAYKTLERLINKEWTTNGEVDVVNGVVAFKGFYGIYDIVLDDGEKQQIISVDFNKKSEKEVTIKL